MTSFMPSGVATSAQNTAVSSAKLGTAAGVATETKVAGLTTETKVGCVQWFRISLNSRIVFMVDHHTSFSVVRVNFQVPSTILWPCVMLHSRFLVVKEIR